MQTNFSNFIIDRTPLKFGNQQADYLIKRDQIIANQVDTIKKAIDEKKDLKSLFHHVISSFAKARHDLAISHETENAHCFGRRRWDSITTINHTDLKGVYRNFNPKILHFLSNLLKNSPSFEKELSEKKFACEEMCLGRKCFFEIEVLTIQDMTKRQWNQMISTGKKDTETDPQIKPIDISKINERNYPPSYEEQELIDAFKNNYKYIKQKYFDFYTHTKMSYLIKWMDETFPPHERIYLPSPGIFYFKENPNYLKSLYILGKVTIEVKGKMCDLSEYITWTHQDGKTDFVKRMRHSVAVIIHQDQFLIDETLNEIANLFEQVILKDKKDDFNDLTQQVALIRYLFAHCMPYERGSAAIGEWLEKLIYTIKGFECMHNNKTMGDLEALTAPLLSTFLENYLNTLTLHPLKMEILEPIPVIRIC